MSAILQPAESIALKIAIKQLQRGEIPTNNIAIVCVQALARLCGMDL